MLVGVAGAEGQLFEVDHHVVFLVSHHPLFLMGTIKQSIYYILKAQYGGLK
jgi:hypothetical protein